MSDKEWETAEDFKYDPFQAFWDFEFNHSQKNDKLRNNQSFSEAWNHQKNKIKKLQAENKALMDTKLNIADDYQQTKLENKKLRECVWMFAKEYDSHDVNRIANDYLKEIAEQGERGE